MKWLKRFFWLLAWAIWLWLGFGLYRELPRDLGPVVCRMPLDSGEEFEGFLRDRPAVLTQTFDSSLGANVFRIRDASTGAILRTTPVNPPTSDQWEHSASAWHQCVIGYESPKFEKGPTEEASGYVHQGLSGTVHVYDLRSGERKVVADLGVFETMHRSKPWALFYGVAGDGRDKVAVLDVETGKRVFELKTSFGAFRRGWRPQFVGDCVAVHFVDGSRGRTELRRISTGEIASTFAETCFAIADTKDGKFATDEWTNSWHRMEVFDGKTGRRLHREEIVKPLTYQGEANSPSFSTDGRFVTSPFTGALIDLETGRSRWRASNGERLLFIAAQNRFEVAEVWIVNASNWHWELATTYAMRDITDGSLIYRTWESTNWGVSNDFGLIWDDGVVRRTTPRVNWPLLVLCQTILALPLVMLWTLLYWRRRRKLQASRERQRPEPSDIPVSA